MLACHPSKAEWKTCRKNETCNPVGDGCVTYYDYLASPYTMNGVLAEDKRCKELQG